MPGIGKVPIQEGSDLGLEFEPGSKPLLVTSVDPESYLAGVIRRGYKVHGLISMRSQKKYKGLNQERLEEKLIETYSETDRKLLVEMGFVDSYVAHIQKGETPFLFSSTREGKLIVDKILDPNLRKQLRPGMLVAELNVKDVGVKITSPSTSDVDLEAVIDFDYSVTLLNPAKKLAAHEKEFPSRFTVDLPNGADLQLKLSATKEGILILKGAEDGSFFYPMAKILSGMVVDTLVIDNFQFHGLRKNQLSHTLEETAAVEGRKLILKGFVSPSNSIPSFRVPLPKGELGMEAEGNPLIISKMDDNSPLNGLIFEGQVVLGFVDANGVEYQDMEDYEFEQLLVDSNDSDNREIIIQNGEAYDENLSTSYEETKCETGDDSNFQYDNESYPNGCAIRLFLPSDDIGIKFAKSPAVISHIQEESPFHGLLEVGQQVLSLKKADGIEYEGVPDYVARNFLIDTEGLEGRTMLVACPGMKGDINVDTLPKIDVSTRDDLPY